MKKAITLAVALLVVTIIVIAGCTQPAAPATETVTTTVTAGAGATATVTSTVTSPASTVTTTRTVTAGEEPEVFNWRMQVSEPPASDRYLEPVKWAENLKDVTGGRLNIEVFSGGAIVPVNDTITACNDGVYEICSSPETAVNTLFPAAGLFFQMSGGLTNNQLHYWLEAGDGGRLMQEMIDPMGNLKWLHKWLLEVPEIWVHTNKVLTGPEDLVGLKMRALGDAGEILDQKMGMAVIFLPGAEVYESMQRGVIDAFEYSNMKTTLALGFNEVAEYAYISSSRAPTGGQSAFVNMEAWNELPDDLKLVLDQAILAETTRYHGLEILWNAEAMAQAATLSNFNVLPLPASIDAAYIQGAAEYYTEKGATDPFTAQVVASALEFKQWAADVGDH